MSMIDCEVLAPAGRITDIAPLIDVGADAIYVGLSGFSARPKSSDLFENEIIESLALTHKHGKKLYVAVNANVPGESYSNLISSIKRLDLAGVDAIIVSDYGLINYLSRLDLNMEIHVSTLAGVYNYRDVQMLKSMGVQRIILSSDLFLDEIVDIIDNVPDLDYEIVADGGICFNSNRQCLLPHIGEKEQYMVFCQKDYDLFKNETYYGHAKRIGNPPGKLHRTLGIYVGMGIKSFKIEGRTNDFSYILQRVSSMVESKQYLIENYSDIPGMMHYIRRNNEYGQF